MTSIQTRGPTKNLGDLRAVNGAPMGNARWRLDR
jgi:hypothetical protein